MRHNALSEARYLYLVAAFCSFTAPLAIHAQTESWVRAMSLAEEHQRLGGYAKAEAALLDALKEAEASGSEGPLVATTFNNLGSLCQRLSRPREAEQYYMRAITVFEKSYGPQEPSLLWPLTNLAFVCLQNGQYEKAERFFGRAQALRIEVLGPFEAQVKAKLLQIQGAIEDHRGDHPKAEALHRQALGLLEQNLGPKHPQVAMASNNLGFLCMSYGDYTEAVSHFQRALAIWQQTPDVEYSALVTTLFNLGKLYHNLGLLPDAEAAFDRALKLAEEVFGPHHREVAEILVNYATVLKLAKRNSEAKRLEKRAKAVLAKQEPDPFTEHTVDIHTLLKSKQRRE